MLCNTVDFDTHKSPLKSLKFSNLDQGPHNLNRTIWWVLYDKYHKESSGMVVSFAITLLILNPTPVTLNSTPLTLDLIGLLP